MCREYEFQKHWCFADDSEVIREFLIESTENLARLDQKVSQLEQNPRDPELLATVFRTVHTIKALRAFSDRQAGGSHRESFDLRANVRARSANVGSGTGGSSLAGPRPACFLPDEVVIRGLLPILSSSGGPWAWDGIPWLHFCYRLADPQNIV
jgi:hypothetical protein